MKLPGRGVTNLDCPHHMQLESCVCPGWSTGVGRLPQPAQLPSLAFVLPAQGRAPVRFQNRGQAVPPASRTPHHSVLRLVRATLDRVLDQHGHVYTDESLLQNIETR